VLWNLPEIKLPLDPVFTLHFGSFTYPVYNTVLLSIVNAVFLIVLFTLAATRSKLIPGPLQNLVEWVLEMMLNLCEEVAGKVNGRRFFPWVAAIFFLILFANWWEVIPGIETIGWVSHDTGISPACAGATGIFLRGSTSNCLSPWLRPPSTDLNFTLGLAVVSFLATQAYGFRVLGLGKQLGRYFNFHEGPMGLVVGIFELLLEPLRIISLGFRLFGNLFAGDALLLVMGFLIPVLGPLPFYALELFIGFIQAFVFAFLTLIFMTLGSTAHGHEEPEETHVAEHARQERARVEAGLEHPGGVPAA
jgi:F-type H+-transporting ATPase subunit a